MYVVSKVVMNVIPPFTLITLRLLLGIVCLAVFVGLRGGFKAARRQVIQVLAVGLVGYGVSLGLQFLGTRLSTAANASLVTSASPAFILLFGAWFLGEKVTPARLMALALATIGVLAVVDPRSAQLAGSAFVGNLALLGAALTWGLYSVLVKLVSAKLATLEVSVIAFLAGLLVSVPAGAVELSRVDVGPITPWLVAGVLYLGLVSTALAMYLWNKSLAVLEAGLVSILFFAQPVVGAALGALVLHEHLGVGFWVGGALIAAGLLLSARPAGRVQPAEAIPRG
jgi:drug/metabolite transporter (DMT)-like permease